MGPLLVTLLANIEFCTFTTLTSFLPLYQTQVMFLALLWFCHRRFSSTCLRIYRVDPGPSFYAVFPRFFLPKRTVPFQSGDVKLKDGIFYIAGKKVYTGGGFFKSYYHIEEMLNSCSKWFIHSLKWYICLIFLYDQVHCMVPSLWSKGCVVN